MSTRDILIQRLQDELNNDPDGVGYAEMSDEEIVSAINNPRTVEILKVDNSAQIAVQQAAQDASTTETIGKEARVFEIIQALPEVANQITIDDIKEAKGE